MEKEIWKTHIDWEQYEFSNLGRYKIYGVISESKQNNRDGYIKIKNRKTKKLVSFHRIIAELFCDGKNDERKIVDHINGLRDDNRAENLRWVTYSENNNNRRMDGIISKKCLKKDSYNYKVYVEFLEKRIERLEKDIDFWFNAYNENEKIRIKNIKQLINK